MKNFLIRLVRAKIFWVAVVILAGILMLNSIQARKQNAKQYITLTVKRQPLVVSVIESGNLVALRSQQVINQVPGTRNVLTVVPEGTPVTDEDVKAKKILVKLDSTDLELTAQQQEINLENAWVTYMVAQQNLEIQKKQNATDTDNAATDLELKHTALEEYLGKQLAEKVLSDTGVNYSGLVNSDLLGGAAVNKKKSLESAIDIAKEDQSRAQSTAEWSEKLAAKGYITKSDLEADNLAFKQKTVAYEQAKLDYQLFLNYDFFMTVQTDILNCRNSRASLERTKATCNSKLIQADANAKSSEKSYLMAKSRLEDTHKQITECVIYASQPGVVTYHSRGWWDQSVIQSGSSVYQYQVLLDLPDFNSMGVEAKIHEASIEKLKAGQTVTVKVDAFPEKIFNGTVQDIAVLPDKSTRFFNPDVNLYVVKVALGGTYDFLKPGMSAKVEIFIEKLDNVICIPVAALFYKGNRSYCTVMSGRTPVEREVKLGKSNDEMVEIVQGLKEGDIVIFTPGNVSPQVQKSELNEKGTIKTKGK